ncbi:MAG: anthranilate synthase component I [Pyrinomonadaceae bacterium]
MDTTVRQQISQAIPVVETMPADLLTPLSVYLKLSEGGGANSFLLESVAGGENLARYSFVGADPEFVVWGRNQGTVVTGRDGTSINVGSSLFDYLREHFDSVGVDRGEDLPSFIGGAIGYFSFPCINWFEPGLYELSGKITPDAEFMIFRTVVAFDHARQSVKIITLVFPNDGEDTETLIGEAQTINKRIRERLEDPSYNLPTPHTMNNDQRSTITSNFQRADFEAAVDQIKELIRAGECYQVVLSQRFSKPTTADPLAVYRALRTINPSPYMFLLKFADKSIVGASPEMLVRSEGRKLTYHPIAGTRKRGVDADEDGRLAEEMRRDKKEVAEHMMLVDLGRNDLGRVAEFGTVKVDELMTVEKYSHVQHLVSTLTAELRDGCDRFDALAACFPAGTVSGAPKVRAVEIIRDLEPTPRGIYSGAVGYFDYSGNMDTCIAIRTLVLENGVAHIQAGAGIVADSVPASEYEETVNKARVLISAIEMAEGGSF